MQQHEAAHVLTRSARRNFWMNVGDGATFAFGLSMVSRYTVLPLFVSRINSDPLLLGVLPALFSLGALISGWALAQLPFPQNVGLLSLLCFGALIVSFVFLALVVEPSQPTQPRVPMGLYLRGLVPLLRRDAAFRSYLFSRSAIGLAL